MWGLNKNKNKKAGNDNDSKEEGEANTLIGVEVVEVIARATLLDPASLILQRLLWKHRERAPTEPHWFFLESIKIILERQCCREEREHRQSVGCQKHQVRVSFTVEGG